MQKLFQQNSYYEDSCLYKNHVLNRLIIKRNIHYNDDRQNDKFREYKIKDT